MNKRKASSIQGEAIEEVRALDKKTRDLTLEQISQEPVFDPRQAPLWGQVLYDREEFHPNSSVTQTHTLDRSMNTSSSQAENKQLQASIAEENSNNQKQIKTNQQIMPIFL